MTRFAFVGAPAPTGRPGDLVPHRDYSRAVHPFVPSASLTPTEVEAGRGDETGPASPPHAGPGRSLFRRLIGA